MISWEAPKKYIRPYDQGLLTIVFLIRPCKGLIFWGKRGVGGVPLDSHYDTTEVSCDTWWTFNWAEISWNIQIIPGIYHPYLKPTLDTLNQNSLGSICISNINSILPENSQTKHLKMDGWKTDPFHFGAKGLLRRCHVFLVGSVFLTILGKWWVIAYSPGSWWYNHYLGGGFKHFLCSPRTWGFHDPIWLL